MRFSSHLNSIFCAELRGIIILNINRLSSKVLKCRENKGVSPYVPACNTPIYQHVIPACNTPIYLHYLHLLYKNMGLLKNFSADDLDLLCTLYTLT